jgi:hypothetical protein
MKQFATIEKIDTGILYCLELAASISILLLAFGLIASMANVLTKGAVLTDNLWMQQVWAWTQCIAIDASVAGTIIRTFRYSAEGEKVKTWLYGLLSILLLFTAVFVPVEALIWIRSLAIVLLIVAHAMRHVELRKPAQPSPGQAAPFVITPELLDNLRVLLTQTTVSETHRETPRLSETATATQEPENGQAAEPITLPGVTREDVDKVLRAFRLGVPRRRMCAHLHWGSSKYATIVKPVLDAYEQQAETA